MQEYDETDLAITQSSTFVGSGQQETDMVFQEGKVKGQPENVKGLEWCDDPVDNQPQKCDQHYIRIRGDGVYTKPLAAHEAGHAVGMVHGDSASIEQANGSKMRLKETDYRMGIMMNKTVLPQGLNQNNRDNINGAY